MTPRLKTGSGTALLLSTLIAAILLAGGPSGGGDPTPTPTPTSTASSTPTPTAGPGGFANVWVAEPGDTCDSTPARESSAVERAGVPAGALACTIAQATSAANSNDTIGVSAGEHGSTTSYQTTWGASGKTLTYLGEDGAIVNTGPTKANYNGFNFNANATVDNIDASGDYPIVGLWDNNVEWRNSRLIGTTTRRDCGSDEPILIEDGSATSYTINARLVNVVVDGIRGMPSNTGSCGSDAHHVEHVRVGRGVGSLLIENVDFKVCQDGASWNGCGSGHVFITTAPSNTWNPRNITIRNSVFRGTPNNAIQVNANVTACVGWTIAYNSFDNDMIVKDGCASGNSVTVVGNAGPRPQTCHSGFTWTRNVWEWGSGTPCGTDTRVTDLNLDADFKPNVGSGAIGGGETPAASDYCTGGLGSVDFLAVARPIGSVCDAGAYEVG